MRNLRRRRLPPRGGERSADHGVIGDLRTVALVGTEGTIDWYCYPRPRDANHTGCMMTPHTRVGEPRGVRSNVDDTPQLVCPHCGLRIRPRVRWSTVEPIGLPTRSGLRRWTPRPRPAAGGGPYHRRTGNE